MLYFVQTLMRLYNPKNQKLALRPGQLAIIEEKFENRSSLKFTLTKTSEMSNILNDERSTGDQDLILKSHNFVWRYLNLYEELLDKAPIFNCMNLYVVPQ